ncbi:MAG: hypothetical protein ABR508_04955 [Candidatus Baltobacteraceae bacterium]
MFDISGPLLDALSGASAQLSQAASQTARAQTPLGTASSDAAMASLAQRTLFTEALLSAVHARLAEVKNVTHG